MKFSTILSLTVLVVLLNVLFTPGSDAGLALKAIAYKTAKLATLGLIGKGAILGPAVAVKGIVLKAKAAGGIAGAKSAVVVSSLKKPLALAKSVIPAIAPIHKPLPPPIVKPHYAPTYQSYAAPPPAPVYSQTNIRNGY